MTHRLSSRSIQRAVAASILTVLSAAALSSAAVASPKPPPVPGGIINTLTLGTYTCELPGDAGGPAGNAVPQYSFRVVSSSTYKNDGVRGSYLLLGSRVMMTGGKLKGFALHRVSDGFLRKLDANGNDEDMRCVLTSRR